MPSGLCEPGTAMLRAKNCSVDRCRLLGQELAGQGVRGGQPRVVRLDRDGTDFLSNTGETGTPATSRRPLIAFLSIWGGRLAAEAKGTMLQAPKSIVSDPSEILTSGQGPKPIVTPQPAPRIH